VTVHGRGASEKSDGHYVLVKEMDILSDGSCPYQLQNGKCVDFKIDDPCCDPDSPTHQQPYGLLSQYGTFKIRGFVEDPANDTSGLDLSVVENANLLLTDPGGKRTGFDSSTDSILQQIPRSAYISDFVEADDESGVETPTTYGVDIFQPSQGIYMVTLTGLQLGTYTLSVRAFSQDGSPQPAVSLQGAAEPGSSSTVTVQYSSIPGSFPTVTPMPGDRNGDGAVNCADIAIVKASFGKKRGDPGFDPRADANVDGIVNVVDLAIVGKGLPKGTKCP